MPSGLVERVIASRCRLTIIFSRDTRDRLDRDRLDVDWTPRATRPTCEIPAPTDQGALSIAAMTQATLSLQQSRAAGSVAMN